MRKTVLILLLFTCLFPLFSTETETYFYYSRENERRDSSEFSLTVPQLSLRVYNIYDNRKIFEKGAMEDVLIGFINNIPPGVRDIISLGAETGFSVSEYDFHAVLDARLLKSGYSDISSAFSFFMSLDISSSFSFPLFVSDDVSFNLSFAPHIKVSMMNAEGGKIKGIGAESIKAIVRRINAGEPEALLSFFEQDVPVSWYFSAPLDFSATLYLPRGFFTSLALYSAFDYTLSSDEAFFLPPSLDVSAGWKSQWKHFSLYAEISLVDLVSPFINKGVTFADMMALRAGFVLFDVLGFEAECLKGYMNYRAFLNLFVLRLDLAYGIKTYSPVLKGERQDYLALAVSLGW
ncbi:MAG TPA: hypothetical protein IAB12_03015 [Candidatus Ornithospirochaeta avicola]|uniref:Uncharacterized protein n=1 Tax=Candidatus Ornithospirochaeta avicola TaxID=2840896 RepID=A0A9D1PTD2_9SPIO|nr:hypothetical protein [Candidatus Ornithospirochaeta avicola]